MTREAHYGPHDCARYRCEDALSGCYYAGQAEAISGGALIRPYTLQAWTVHTLYQALTALGTEPDMASDIAWSVAK